MTERAHDDLLGESVLRRCVKGEAAVEFWPFDPSVGAIRVRVAEALATSCPDVLLEFGSYSELCPYASFTDLFAFALEDQASSLDGYQTAGLRIFISLLAPVAVIGADTVHRFPMWSGCNGIVPSTVGTTPSSWSSERVAAVVGAIASCGLEVLTGSAARQPILFDPPATFETNIGSPPYCVFDAFFYWYD